MTKAENKAAAKAWRAEQERLFRKQQQQTNVAADIEKLREFRWYFLLRRKVQEVHADALIAALDDHAERLTGDRTALHMKRHSIP